MIIGIGLNNAGNIYLLIMEEVERSVLEIVLQETRFNLVKTAKLLGISRATLYRRIKVFGITQEKLFDSKNSATDLLPASKDGVASHDQSSNTTPLTSIQ